MNYSVHLSSNIYRHACVCAKRVFFLLDGPVLEVKMQDSNLNFISKFYENMVKRIFKYLLLNDKMTGGTSLET
jgi:hypothetical protein